MFRVGEIVVNAGMEYTVVYVHPDSDLVDVYRRSPSPVAGLSNRINAVSSSVLQSTGRFDPIPVEDGSDSPKQALLVTAFGTEFITNVATALDLKKIKYTCDRTQRGRGDIVEFFVPSAKLKAAKKAVDDYYSSLK
jgi:hypothetical protein